MDDVWALESLVLISSLYEAQNSNSCSPECSHISLTLYYEI